MKKLILWTAAALVVGAFAVETNWNAVVAATLRSDGSTNTWTQADLMDALGLLNRKYWRDMESQEGRRKWHGTPRHHYVTNATERTVERIEIYPDGYTNVVRGTKRKLRTPEEEAAYMLERRQRRERAYASMVETLRAKVARLEEVLATSTNDLERAHATIDLYQARRQLTRAEAAQTNVVTVVIQPGEK
jgi:hypothetical protein